MGFMLRKVVLGGWKPWQMVLHRCGSKTSSTHYPVDSVLLGSLKQHYIKVAQMKPPPKILPPSPFKIHENCLELGGAVLHRTYNEEEIDIYVTRFTDLLNVRGATLGKDDSGIHYLFMHVSISKPGWKEALHFLCELYPDALGITGIQMRPNLEELRSVLQSIKKLPHYNYSGPKFKGLDIKMQDAFAGYLDVRGVDTKLYEFLYAWLYVRDHRNLLRWFKAVGTFVSSPT